jgi:ribosomal protein S18 acetylase RimI-like enzyme
VRLQFLDHEAAYRLAQLLVLVGADEVLALAVEVRLEDIGGHLGSSWVRSAARTLGLAQELLTFLTASKSATNSCASP